MDEPGTLATLDRDEANENSPPNKKRHVSKKKKWFAEETMLIKHHMAK